MTAAAPLDAAALRAALAEHELDLLYFESTGSTNAEVLRHYEATGREAAAVAETQTAGRGRRGRAWHSPPGRNIYCTLGIVKAVPAARQALLAIASGIALCRVLREQTGAAVELKWPNDLVAEGCKLGGILAEARTHDERRQFFAIGFGINLALGQSDLAAIAQPATGLERISARSCRRDELLTSLIDGVLQSVRGFDDAASRQLADEFAEFDAYHGCEVEVLEGERRIRGIGRGIAADGQFRLETGNGLRLFSAAEISLRGKQS